MAPVLSSIFAYKKPKSPLNEKDCVPEVLVRHVFDGDLFTLLGSPDLVAPVVPLRIELDGYRTHCLKSLPQPTH